MLKMADTATTILLVETIENYPVIYDYMRTDYSNRNAQDKAWEEISKQVKISATACKEKWKNVRNSYTRHLRQIASSGSSAKVKKPYYLADHLYFLDNFSKNRSSKGNISYNIPDDSYESDNISENSYNTKALDPIIKEEVPEILQNTEEISSNQDVLIKQEQFTESTLQNSFKRKKGNTQTSLQEVNKYSLEYLESVNNELPSNIDSYDPDLAFFVSVLPDVKEMTREQKRKFRIEVIKLAGNILSENDVTTVVPETTAQSH